MVVDRRPIPAAKAASAAGASTIGASTVPVYPPPPARKEMALLSPVAPELVASAASVKMTVPRSWPGQAQRPHRGTRAAAASVVDGPEPLCLGEASRAARGVAIGHDERARQELRHVSERVADEHPGRQSALACLDRLATPAVGEPAEQAVLRDQLVAADQRRDGDAGGDRPDPSSRMREQCAAREPVVRMSTWGYVR
jgi:hypothetical protein